VTHDELAMACRMTGHSLDDLWVRYLSTGGNRARSELSERLAGASWPEAEERILQVAVDDALRDLGLPLLTESLAAREARLCRLGPSAMEEDPPRQHDDDAASTGASPAFDLRLRELIARSARARSAARSTRAWARSVRQDEGASRRQSPGGP